jgi:hypothetical protein
MRNYLYDTNMLYIGFTDDDPMVGATYTTVEPGRDDHAYWNGTSWDIPTPVALTLEEEKIKRIQEVREFWGEIIQSLIVDTAEFELDTWAIQTAEWTRWINDNTVATPYADRLALIRGINRVVLLGKIGVKVLDIAGAQGSLHKKEDDINAATTTAEVKAISLM